MTICVVYHTNPNLIKMDKGNELIEVTKKYYWYKICEDSTSNSVTDFNANTLLIMNFDDSFFVWLVTYMKGFSTTINNQYYNYFNINVFG